MHTLVLNSAYLPIDKICWSDAVADIIIGRAEVVECYEGQTVRSGQNSKLSYPDSIQVLATDELGVWKVPSIIRFLGKSVFEPRHVKFNRHNVWLRDGGRCQYCNTTLRTQEFTYDHVIPQSRGGKTNWENIVCACFRCNHSKANKTPEEARMTLHRKPYRPTQLPGQLSPALSWKEGMPESWKSFLVSVRYWHVGLK